MQTRLALSEKAVWRRGDTKRALNRGKAWGISKLENRKIEISVQKTVKRMEGLA